MSHTATGRIVNEKGEGQDGLQVVLKDVSYILTSDIGKPVETKDGGYFTIGPYAEDVPNDYLSARIFLIVVTKPSSVRELYSEQIGDIPNVPLIIPDIIIRNEIINGFVVTGGKDARARLTTGNAIQFLIDNKDAWNYFTTITEGAQNSIDLMQLWFDIGPYRNDISREKPKIVTRFDSNNPFVSGQAHIFNSIDVRPERLLLKIASDPFSNVKVRILMPVPIDDVHSLVVVLLIALLPIIGPIILAIIHDMIETEDEVADYFANAPSNRVSVQPFPVTNYTRVHAKACIVDDQRAIIIGSPFQQGYFDDYGHKIDDPRRIGAEGEPFPVHDVSLGLRGPAVADVQKTFQMHWDVVSPNTLGPAQPISSAGIGPQEYEAAIQVIRTLPSDVFPDPELNKNGETQILESYLRAIENATEFIYLENQYFTNESIAKSLIKALNYNSRLQVIVLINITPDIPCYPTWQKHRIQEILAHVDQSRIEFFTAWTHEAMGPNGKPRIIPNYIHSKVAIVDDKWATVGSANIDGNSLDEAELLHLIQFGKLRNTELNCAIYNAVEDGMPKTTAIDELRKMLWSEHLGIPVTDSQLSYESLQGIGPNSGKWLELWRNSAKRKRSTLQLNPTMTDPARILEFPHPGGKIPENPVIQENRFKPWNRKYADDGLGFLINAGITNSSLEYVPKLTSFDLTKGKFA